MSVAQRTVCTGFLAAEESGPSPGWETKRQLKQGILPTQPLSPFAVMRRSVGDIVGEVLKMRVSVANVPGLPMHKGLFED